MSGSKRRKETALKTDTAAHSSAEFDTALQNIVLHVKNDDPAAAIGIVQDWDAHEIIEMIVHLPVGQARTFLAWLPRSRAAEIIEGMHPAFKASVLRVDPDSYFSDTLDTVHDGQKTNTGSPDAHGDEKPDEVVDVYPRGTAGYIMQRSPFTVPEDANADDVIQAIRREFSQGTTTGTIIVINDAGTPVGIFRPRDVLKTDPEVGVHDFMEKSFPVIQTDDDGLGAAQLLEGTGFMGLPVVDEQGRLVGQITPKVREQILAENRRRNFLRLSSVSPKSSSTDGVKGIIKGRLPWLLAGLIGATVAAIVIGSFEEQLEAAAILAAFIPVVMSMAGNSGLQASGVSVQALASGKSWPGDRLIWRVMRECLGALSNGAIAGTILAGLVMLASTIVDIENPMNLAMATSLSLMSVTTIAAIVGSTVPFALNRFGINPANATGVFITTSNDVVGVLVYFGMADLFYF